MKYTVNLLPEWKKKQLRGKEKVERIRVVALVALLMSLGLLVLVMGSRFYAYAKLSQIQSKNNECVQKTGELEQYKQTNNKLQEKIKLLKNIAPKDPLLQDFTLKIGNINHPGISLTSIECINWNSSKTCIITGKSDSRKVFLEYVKTLSGMNDYVETVNISEYSSGIGTEDGLDSFVITITAIGGMQVEDTIQANDTAEDATVSDSTSTTTIAANKE